ncbi:hypothetical protein [Dehalobacter restrictus]|uniref:Uncharacterized protein n=1 Tax=Dehalobacter restrictus TaxID=55583 RepID=A0A857DII8_9FIRM|nr:hypothetical protein [Dehalobacter restrictus]QHA00531.1 hypothetical protein GQ588_07755 [Dehalobacter restrictus]
METFRSAFTESDLIDGATVSVLAGQFVKLGEYQVQAGELVAVGYGAESGQESAQGRIYALLKDGEAVPGIINGVVRVSIYSPQDRPIEILQEYRTETLNTSSTDRTKQVPLPLINAFVSEDKKIVLEMKADANATLTKANCDLIMDITKAVV